MEKKIRICLFICLFFALSLLFCAYLWSPSDYRYVEQGAKKYQGKYTMKQFSYSESVEIDDENNVSIVGEAPIIAFWGKGYSAGEVVLKLAKPAKNNIIAHMYIDSGAGYTAIPLESMCYAGEDSFTFYPNGTKIYGIKLFVTENYSFDRIEFYKVNVRVLFDYDSADYKGLFIGVGLALFITLILLILDYRLRFTSYIVRFVANNISSLIRISVGVLLYLIVVGLAFKLKVVNPYVVTVMVSAVFTICILVVERNRMASNPEIATALVLLTIGIAMIICQPYGHISWDTNYHFMASLADSFLGETKYTDADMLICSTDRTFLTIPGTYEANVEKIKFVNNLYANPTYTQVDDFNISHLPAGIGIAILRLLGLNFYWIYTLGRIPNLLLYVLATYLGMRKLKSGKMIFAVVAAFPTSLFLACSYSYDFWVVCFSLMGMGYFIGACQKKDEKISVWDTLVMCCSLAIACSPKQVYFLLLFIPFFMPRSRINNKKVYYLICTFAFVLLMISLGARSIIEISSGGDTRGSVSAEAVVNSGSQLQFILQQPFAYATILINHMKTYLSLNEMGGYISDFAYLGYGKKTFIVQAILLLAILTDKNEYDKKSYSLLLRLVIYVVAFGSAVLVATSMYISFTPYGSASINGCQYRYLLPVIYPAMAVIGNEGLCKIQKVKAYNTFFTVCTSYVLLDYIVTVMLRYMR